MEKFPKFESAADSGSAYPDVPETKTNEKDIRADGKPEENLASADRPAAEDETRAGEEAYYERLGERIRTITELRGELEREDMRGGEFVRNADAKMVEILDGCRESATAKLDEKERLIRQSEEIDAVIAGLDYDFLSPEVQKLSGENDGIRERIREIRDDPDVRLFDALSGAKIILKGKAQRFEKFRAYPSKVQVPARIKGRGVGIVGKETVFSSLSINFLLNDREMEGLGYGPGTYGVHFDGDVFNVIRKSGDPEDDARSIRHENMHSIYEAFDNRSGGNIAKRKDAQEEISRLLQAIDTGSPTVQKMQFEALVERSRRIVFSSKGELIANFEELRVGKLHTELAAFYEVKDYLRSVREALKSPSNNRRDGTAEIAEEYLDKYLSELQKAFDSFYSSLGDLFFIAEHEGKMDELKSSMILFDAAEYSRIAEYFRHEIGEGKYGFYTALRSIARDRFFNISRRKIDEVVAGGVEKGFGINDIVKVAEAIRANPDFLTPEIRREILSSLDSLESKPAYAAATSLDVEGCESAYQAIRSLANAIGGGMEYARSAIENILDSAFLDAVDGDLTKLNYVIANLSGEHDGIIADSVEDYIKGEAKNDFGGLEELKRSLFWQVLVSSDRTRDAALRAIS